MSPSRVATGLDRFAALRGDDLAIVSPARSITFAELAEQTASLATSILERSPRGPWLPILVDRSIESVIAVMAAIRAGVPFSAIDGAQSRPRLLDLVHRMGTPGNPPDHVLVGRSDLGDVLAADATVISPGARSAGVSDPAPIDPTRPGSLMFTSGTTGTPKGVIRTWSAFDTRLDDPSESDKSFVRRTSALRPLSFAGGLGQMAFLASGETQLLYDPRSSSLEDMLAWLVAHEVTVAQLGAGPTDALLRSSQISIRLESVREIFIAHSQCRWEHVPKLRQVFNPDIVVVNTLRITEAGEVAMFKATPDMELGTGRLPIGRLSESDRIRLVPIDDGLEMWMRDPYSLGYLDQPDLTAERYVLDEGVRWWRSGDLGRVDDEGLLYHLGRIDDMVKIHGMRVEPGEAEFALRTVPGVKEASVLPHPTSNGTMRLVGHVCIDDPRLTPERLRAAVSAVLPSHLVPAFFVRHDALPYTERLKLDRSSLLKMPLDRWRSTAPEKTFHEPVLWLAAKIRDIIGLGDVAPNDDMWEAGLDSMGAVELCSAIAAQGMGDIDPTDLLAHRTAIDLDAHLSSARPMVTSPCIVFNENGTRSPMFAVPGSGGTAFAFRSLATDLGDDQPLIVIEPVGMHCRGRIERTVAARVRTALEEISERSHGDDPVIVFGYSGGATIAVEIVRALSARRDKVHLILLDGPPRDRTHNAFAIDWRGRLLPAPPSDTSAGARVRWIGRRARHALRNVLEIPGSVRLRVRPGKRRFSKRYYNLYKRINRCAVRRHELQVLSVPTTLIHIENSRVPQMCESWFTDFTAHCVGGDHFSMLHPPHVAAIARHVLDIREGMSSR